MSLKFSLDNRIKFPKDFFRYCSVHQHGRRDVTWKRRIGEGVPGGVRVPMFPMKNLQLFPCSSKIYWGVPRNSLLLSSPAPRNSAPCSLAHQKYSSLFPTIPSKKNKIFDLSPGQGPINEKNCNTLPKFCRRKGLFPCYTLKTFFQWPGNQCSLVPDYNSTVPSFTKSYFKISLVP